VDCDGEPDVQLVANGSEVATLIEAAKVLVEEKSLKVKVVSAPSEGLFREQDRDYQKSVLAPRAPTFGLTAGLAAGLQGLVGPFGKVFGMSRFGASAPYKVLDEKFGFTPGQVIERVEAYLRDYRATAESYLTADA
jgi:transketolase